MIDGSTEAQLEAVVRLSSARDTLDLAVGGDPAWFRSDAVRALSYLLSSAAVWLARSEAMAS
ncbi:MAG: hypothetical protein M3256_15330 [Actinomycetota bacterium]|nr:hypothetical protein [Actinomycetota bacterium]